MARWRTISNNAFFKKVPNVLILAGLKYCFLCVLCIYRILLHSMLCVSLVLNQSLVKVQKSL